MSGRYRQAGAGDAPIATEGDGGFLGVDMRRQPEELEPGMMALAINKDFSNRKAAPRKGMRTVVWGRELGADFPWDFPLDFTGEQGLGVVYGAVVFADPNGQERAVVACAQSAYVLSAGAPLGTVPYPSGVVLDGPVTFTQGFNVLILWRGRGLRPFKMETQQGFAEELEFELVEEDGVPSEDYTSAIPAAERALFLANRMWMFLPDGSTVGYSDLMSYTRWDATLQRIWVNAGGSDLGQVLVGFGEDAILAFKAQSIYAITGISEVQQAYLQQLTDERGTVAPDSVAQAGKDYLFLADNGVYAVSQVLDNKLQVGAEPLSAPLEPLMRRVNWAYAGAAQGVVHGNKYLLAVPIDGATYNNAVVVYDFVNQRWSGWWEGAWLDVKRWLRMTVNGERRLVMVAGTASGDARARGAVFLCEAGFTDMLFSEEAMVADRVVTRAYAFGTNLPKRFLGLEVELETWCGAGEVRLILDGVNEVQEVMAYEKDRTRSYLFARAPYDPTNAAGDHGEPKREDYSVVLTEGQNWAAGMNPGLHQHASERAKIRATGRSVQVEIRGTRGRNVLKALQIEAAGDREELRTQV